MILGLQLIALTFALIMIYISYLHYKRGELNGLEVLFWLIAWLAAVSITLFPKFFSLFAQTIAISRTFDLAVVGGFILVIVLTYQNYIRAKRVEKKFEEYIRQEALSHLPGSKKR